MRNMALTLSLYFICSFVNGQQKFLDTAFAYYFTKKPTQNHYCRALQYFEKAMQVGELANYPYYYAAQSACQCNEQEKALLYFKKSVSKTIDFYNYTFFVNDTLNNCFNKTDDWNHVITQMKIKYDSFALAKNKYIKRINDTSLRLNEMYGDFKKIMHLTNTNITATDLKKYIQAIHFEKPPVLNHWTLYTLKNQANEDVPFLFYIPQNYDYNSPTPLAVYLHGAVGRKNYSSSEMIPEFEESVLSHLEKMNSFIIYPFAKSNFNWVDHLNALKLVTEEIKFIKKLYNIDDNRVYLGGHSDGARGTLWFSLFNQTPFASFYALAMPNKLLVDDTKLANLGNQQTLYTLNGTNDRLYEFKDLQNIFDTNASKRLNWKLYSTNGDHNFMKDYPKEIMKLFKTLFKQKRRIIPHKITIETGRNLPVSYHWLKVSDSLLNKQSLITCTYSKNSFYFTTSRDPKHVSLLIPYGMINYQKNIRVFLNNKLIKKILLKPESNILLKNFINSADRKILISNEVDITL